jgi:hypothetical protein
MLNIKKVSRNMFLSLAGVLFIVDIIWPEPRAHSILGAMPYLHKIATLSLFIAVFLQWLCTNEDEKKAKTNEK